MSAVRNRRRAIAPHAAPALPALVQSGVAANNSGTTLSCNWPGATTAGNLLVLIVGCSGGAGVTLTTPAGWTKVGEVNSSTKLAIFRIENASSHSGSQSVTISSSQVGFVCLSEWSGVAAASALEGFNSTSGTSTTGSTSAYTTTNAGDLLIGAIHWGAAGSAFTVGSPTNGFTLEEDEHMISPFYALNMLYKVGGATGSETAGVTASGTVAFTGMLAAFKAA